MTTLDFTNCKTKEDVDKVFAAHPEIKRVKRLMSEMDEIKSK